MENLVDNYIEDTFMNCKISDLDIFPNGRIVEDKSGAKLLIYQDINCINRIVVTEPHSDFKQILERCSGNWIITNS